MLYINLYIVLRPVNFSISPSVTLLSKTPLIVLFIYINVIKKL